MKKQTQNRLAALKNNVSKYGVGAVVSTALLTSNANAAFDVTTALSGADAQSNIETAGLWALGMGVTIYGIKRVIAFFGR